MALYDEKARPFWENDSSKKPLGDWMDAREGSLASDRGKKEIRYNSLLTKYLRNNQGMGYNNYQEMKRLEFELGFTNYANKKKLCNKAKVENSDKRFSRYITSQSYEIDPDSKESFRGTNGDGNGNRHIQIKQRRS